MFLGTEDEIKELFNSTICLGEVLGKHSEVSFDLDEEDIEQIQIPDDVLSNFLKYVPNLSVGVDLVAHMNECKLWDE